MRRRLHARWFALVTAVVSSVALVTLAAAPADATTYPVPYDFGAGLLAETLHPGSSPPGSNDWSCRPSAAHPYPVVLVHGTFGDMTDSWQALSPLLKNHGYCVFALDYGGAPGDRIQATGDIPTSAAQLGAFVSRVLTATGATKVDVVGHSQGGMMPRWYIKFDGGDRTVHALVGLAPSNHGTTLFGLATLANAFPGGSSFVGALCTACNQQVAGSSFLQTLNGGGDTVPGPLYTVIETKYDEVVTPYTSAFLSGPHVTNITLQDQCALDYGEHLAIIYDEVALHDVLNALDPAHATPPPCTVVLPGVGG
ncbi:MAG TPA: alpha/beta fold hydrolase [Acidimicrobiia bacterium]|nr:alpha/beta fold hydrolase [Acidimicrobiia bacterium]